MAFLLAGGVERILWQESWPAEDQAPTPPFRFLEEDEGGTSPKIRVQDANRNIWMVKFGSEAKPDVFGSRLARACGYWTPPTYFVAAGEVTELGDMYRASEHIRKGRFRDACFKLRQPTVRGADGEHWTWQQNPFQGTRELNGLKILIMLLSNWDNKDARDIPRGSNTVVLEREFTDGRRQLLYTVIDWGASLGKWGGVTSRGKWDCEGFRRQNAEFVQSAGADAAIRWGYIGQHVETFNRDILPEHVRWFLKRLEPLTADLQSELQASGADRVEAECFASALRQRIDGLRSAAGSSLSQLLGDGLRLQK